MKAIIPAAGLGTRFLPATKAQPKEMLLVKDRPCIQYVVEEALAAKADEVVIVNSRNKKSIEEHFSPDEDLVSYLRRHGKDFYADVVAHAGSLPVSFVYQDEPLGLGHAIHCAASRTGDEPFYVLLGDVLVPGNDILPRMLQVHEEHDGANVIAVIPLPDDQVSRYGIIDGQAVADDVWKISGLVEKPRLEDAPSHYGILGRYLLSPKTMAILENAQPTVGGEIQLTDALDELIRTEEMYAVIVDPASGMDTGTIETWLDTNISLALRDPEMGPWLRRRIADRLV